MRRAGFSEAPESGMEPGGPRAFQYCREPQGCRRPVRISGDLYHAVIGAGQGATSAAGAGAARVRGRGKQGTPLVTAGSGAAGVGDVPVVEGHGGRGGDLSSAALDAAGGLATSERRPAA